MSITCAFTTACLIILSGQLPLTFSTLTLTKPLPSELSSTKNIESWWKTLKKSFPQSPTTPDELRLTAHTDTISSIEILVFRQKNSINFKISDFAGSNRECFLASAHPKMMILDRIRGTGARYMRGQPTLCPFSGRDLIAFAMSLSMKFGIGEIILNDAASLPCATAVNQTIGLSAKVLLPILRGRPSSYYSKYGFMYYGVRCDQRRYDSRVIKMLDTVEKGETLTVREKGLTMYKRTKSDPESCHQLKVYLERLARDFDLIRCTTASLDIHAFLKHVAL